MKNLEYTFVLSPCLSKHSFGGLAPAQRFVKRLEANQSILKFQLLLLKVKAGALARNVRFLRMMTTGGYFFFLKKLSVLYLSDFIIQEIDIGLSMCDDGAQHFRHLESLHLTRVKIKAISTVFPTISRLSLDSANQRAQSLHKLPDTLEKLCIRDMDMRAFEEADADHSFFLRFHSLKKVSLTLCLLKHFPRFHTSVSSLYKLSLQHNLIAEVPPRAVPASVLYLNLSFNELSNISGFPKNLVYLDVKYNKLTHLPSDLLLCDRLMMIHFDGNPLVPSLPHKRKLQEIPPSAYFEVEREIQTQRRKHRCVFAASVAVRNLDLATNMQCHVYGDGQNVHNTSIQKSFLEAACNLFRGLNHRIVFSGLGDEHIDNLLLSWFKTSARHSVLRVTFKELFFAVWTRITQLPKETQQEAIKRLCQEVIDAENKCFVGQMTRMVNALVGFCDDIHLRISSPDQIYAVIQRHIEKHKTIERHILTQELAELELSFTQINEWIDAFQE